MKDFLKVKKGKGVYETDDRLVYMTGLLMVGSFFKYVSARNSIEMVSESIQNGDCSVETAEILALIASAVTKQNVTIDEFMESTDERLEKISKYVKERDKSLSSLEKHFGLSKKAVEEFYDLWCKTYPKMTSGIGGSSVVVCTDGLLNGLFVYLYGESTKEEFEAFVKRFKSNPLIPNDILRRVRKMVFLTARLFSKYIEELVANDILFEIIKDKTGTEQEDKPNFDRFKVVIASKSLFHISKTYSEIKDLLGLSDKEKLVFDFISKIKEQTSDLGINLDTKNEQAKEEVQSDK